MLTSEFLSVSHTRMWRADNEVSLKIGIDNLKQELINVK